MVGWWSCGGLDERGNGIVSGSWGEGENDLQIDGRVFVARGIIGSNECSGKEKEEEEKESEGVEEEEGGGGGGGGDFHLMLS